MKVTRFSKLKTPMFVRMHPLESFAIVVVILATYPTKLELVKSLNCQKSNVSSRNIRLTKKFVLAAVKFINLSFRQYQPANAIWSEDEGIHDVSYGLSDDSPPEGGRNT